MEAQDPLAQNSILNLVSKAIYGSFTKKKKIDIYVTNYSYPKQVKQPQNTNPSSFSTRMTAVIGETKPEAM